jgi:hypothetical protein
VVWDNDPGDIENESVQDYRPDRAARPLEPDARPPHLKPCRPRRIELLPIH